MNAVNPVFADKKSSAMQFRDEKEPKRNKFKRLTKIFQYSTMK